MVYSVWMCFTLAYSEGDHDTDRHNARVATDDQVMRRSRIRFALVAVVVLSAAILFILTNSRRDELTGPNDARRAGSAQALDEGESARESRENEVEARPSGSSVAADPHALPVEDDFAQRVLLAYRATSLEDLVATLERLPASNIDRRLLLSSAHWACEGASRSAEEIARGMVEARMTVEQEAIAQAAAWQGMARRFCTPGARGRLEMLWRAASDEEAIMPLEGVAEASLAEPSSRVEVALRRLATSQSPTDFANAAAYLAELEVGPFAKGASPGPADPGLRQRIAVAAIEYATCEWSMRCGPGTLWMIHHCRDAPYCQPNADHRVLFQQMFGPADLRRIQQLSDALLSLRRRVPDH